jgi:hypothetical protein
MSTTPLPPPTALRRTRARSTRHVDLREVDVDLRDAVVSPSQQPYLDGTALELVGELAAALGDPQVDLLLTRVHKARGHRPAPS